MRIDHESVMKTLDTHGPRALHLMEVVARLGLPKSQKSEVREALDALAGLGMIKEMPGNRFRVQSKRRSDGGSAPKRASRDRRDRGPSDRRDRRGSSSNDRRGRRRSEPPAHKADKVRGWLSQHPRGFAFVTADDGQDDVFIPPGASLNGAWHGDRVEVACWPSPKGREGKVLSVLERGLRRVSGVLTKRRKWRTIETTDPRLPEQIEVVGELPLGVRSGMEVIGLLDHVPEPEELRKGILPRARVIAALPPRGSAAAEIERIKIREGVLEDFPEAALREAQSYGDSVAEAEKGRREDLRHLDLVTIDPADARDHDDAVWAEKTEGGGYKVVVAIADVGHYVPRGSALDQEARRRGCSLYLPEGVTPMLPPELSAHLASLVPDEDRLCMAVEVELGPRGAVQRYRIFEGLMRSKARMSYTGAALALGLIGEDEGERQPAAEARLPLLSTLYDLSRILRGRRKRRGSLFFELPEPKVLLDESGEPRSVIRAKGSEGKKEMYATIEEMMLLANEVVARHVHQKKIPSIYRVHGKPDGERLRTFAELARSLGHELSAEEAEKPRVLSRFLNQIKGTPREGAVNYLLLRAMQQAAYSTERLGHFALAAPDYLHFTSPIRRYPDLAVHRVLKDELRGASDKGARGRKELLGALREDSALSSHLERKMLLVEREVLDLYRTLLMKGREGEEHLASISGVTERGLYATLDDPFVEVFLAADGLGEERYELDPLGLRLVAPRSGHSFSLGDRLRVRIENVSVEDRRIEASMVAELEEGKAQGKPEGHSAPKRKRSRPSLVERYQKEEPQQGKPRKGRSRRGQRRRAS